MIQRGCDALTFLVIVELTKNYTQSATWVRWDSQLKASESHRSELWDNFTFMKTHPSAQTCSSLPRVANNAEKNDLVKDTPGIVPTRWHKKAATSSL